MVWLNLLVSLGAFIAIWYGAGLIVSSAVSFSKRLHLSSFAFSFFILGLLTSTPEFGLGLTALSENNPEIFVGNLIGGVVVIFFFIIPLLAILGKGIKLHHELSNKNLILSFLVMLSPVFFLIDRQVTNLEAVVLIILYFVLFFFIQREHGIFDTENSHVLEIKYYSFKDILKVLLGVGIVFVASRIIVDNTLYFASFFHISPFYISLIILSLGTNLPELSLAIKSVISGTKDVAFGDYIGSAAVNTLFFGLFSLLHNGTVTTVDNFFTTFCLIAFGLGLFYFFSTSKHDISRQEGFLLLCLYVIFVLVENV